MFLDMKKTMLIGVTLLCLAGSAFAIDSAGLDERVRRLTAKFTEMQSKSDKRVPADKLAKAQAVILLDRTKAGFLFVYEGGRGVALLRNPTTRAWSAPGFVTANEASLGFQVGGEQAFYVILLMSTNVTRSVTDTNLFQFGGEASGTAGDKATGASGVTSTADVRSVIVYSDRVGLYGGVAIKGGSINEDKDANRIYYGESLTMREILVDNKAKAGAMGTALIQKLDSASVTNQATANK